MRIAGDVWRWLEKSDREYRILRSGGGTLFLDFEDEHGDIVELFGAACEFPDAVHDPFEVPAQMGLFISGPVHDGEKAFFAEDFSVCVGCLGDAVGVAEEAVAFAETEFPCVIFSVFHNSESKALVETEPVVGGSLALEERRIVPAVDVMQDIGAEVVNAEEHGYEHADIVVFTERLVGAFDDFGGSVTAEGVVFESGFGIVSLLS